MGLRITESSAAMNAYRSLSVTDGQMAKSLEKLPSGFRSNDAADDDAAGELMLGVRSLGGDLRER
jgi:flagellin